MAVSVYNSILDAMVATIQSTNLAGINLVEKAKLPAAEESIDSPLPIIRVVPSENPERFEWTSYEGDVNVGYEVQVVVIAAGNQTLVTGLDLLLNWRQLVRQAFGTRALPVVPSVFDIETNPEVVIDRTLVNQNYDYSGLGFVVWSAENRSAN